jgi:hypothetical protein
LTLTAVVEVSTRKQAWATLSQVAAWIASRPYASNDFSGWGLYGRRGNHAPRATAESWRAIVAAIHGRDFGTYA